MQDMYRSDFSNSEYVNVSCFAFFLLLLRNDDRLECFKGESKENEAKMVKRLSNNKVFVITFGASFRAIWSGQLSFYERITPYFHTFSWLTSNLWFWPIDFIRTCVPNTANAKFYEKRKKITYFIVVCYFICRHWVTYGQNDDLVNNSSTIKFFFSIKDNENCRNWWKTNSLKWPSTAAIEQQHWRSCKTWTNNVILFSFFAPSSFFFVIKPLNKMNTTRTIWHHWPVIWMFRTHFIP